MRGDPILFKAIRASGNWAYLQIKAYYPPSLREAILPGNNMRKLIRRKTPEVVHKTKKSDPAILNIVNLMF